MQPSLLRFRSVWLLVPPILLCCLDLGLTLYGQSDAYWSGNYGHVDELSPSFGRSLALHPLAFVATGLAWVSIFSSLISILPEKLAMMLSICVVMGHMTGAASWLAYRFGSYQACNGLFLLTAVAIVTAFNWGRSDNGQAVLDWSRTGLPAWTRWVVVAMLLVVPSWWFLIPH
jgi:hypothetical protein